MGLPLQVDPFPDNKTRRPTREIEEFPPQPVYHPATTYKLVSSLPCLHMFPYCSAAPLHSSVHSFTFPLHPFVNLFPRNFLYVCPRSLDFKAGKGRNIGIRVLFMAGEEKEDACCVIYGRSSGPSFLRETWSSVLYHNRYICACITSSPCSYPPPHVIYLLPISLLLSISSPSLSGHRSTMMRSR